MKPFRLIFICLCVWGIGGGFMFHPFYISITDVFFNPESNALEITIRMFTNDVEQALEEQGTGRLFMGTDRQSEDMQRYLERYVEQHFRVKKEGEPLPYTYLGQEVETEHTWCYLELKLGSSPTQLSIVNSLLMDTFESQRNLVHVKVGQITKSLLLEKGKASGEVHFSE